MSVTSIVERDTEVGGDGWTLTVLAQKLGERIPLMCFEQLLRDGRQNVSTMSIPRNVDQRSFAIYKRFTKLARINLSDAVVSAVTERQIPAGFRIVGDPLASVDAADEIYYQNHMDLQIPLMCEDVGWHGMSFTLVAQGYGNETIHYVSPWACEMSDDEDAGIIYSFDEVKQVERIMLLRLERDEHGKAVRVYSHTAERESESPTLVSPADMKLVEQIGDTYDSDAPRTWKPQSGWHWVDEQDSSSFQYAVACDHIPLFRQRSSDMHSQIFKHIGTIQRIDHSIFDRLCITTMQAFRQRAVKGLDHLYYEEGDPQVENGLANIGDPVDFAATLTMGPAGLWALPEGVDVWESATTDIRQLTEAESAEIKNLAQASRTPLDLLSPDVQGSASGADLKREGLIFKVNRLNKLANDMLVRVVRMALTLQGNGDVASRFEMTWEPVADVGVLEKAQAMSFVQATMPVRTALRMIWKMTPSQIAEAEKDLTDTEFQSLVSSLSDNGSDSRVGGGERGANTTGSELGIRQGSEQEDTSTATVGEEIL